MYEEVRAEMAADRLDGVPARASRLAETLRLAVGDSAKLEEPTSALIEETAVTAESMAKAEDLATARVAFGQVSRGILRLASSDTRLAEGWHAFACPMVQTFNKWIQPTEVLENPYMGKAMPKCGTSTDWSVPVLASVEVVEAVPVPAGKVIPPGTKEVARAEPEFKPGIPGVKMVDVRDHKFLWREIAELQSWEKRDQISVAEYRSKVIEKTAHFLELEGTAADAFTTTTSEAITTVRQSFRYRRPSGADQSGIQGQFSTDLGTAVTRMYSLLKEEPRHKLFAPECKKWLLRLAFGPSEAKEAREAQKSQQARVDNLGKLNQ